MTTVKWLQPTICASALLAFCGPAGAVGTAAGTVIENTADVVYDMGGTSINAVSNTTSFTVAERIDVVVTLVSGQVTAAADDQNRTLLFVVTNTGNGTESFQLTVDSALGGDDFDPLPSVPAIYFDTDNSGDFNAGDVAYEPGLNDPDLAPDQAINMLVLNHMPSSAADGQVGRSQLIATSNTGTGTAGTVFANAGDNSVDAVIGTSEGDDVAAGEYLIENIFVDIQKTQLVADPGGGNEPITGATLTYTISVAISGSGVANDSAVRDAIPTYSTYVPNSILLNGTPISDATDGDAGEFDAATPTVVVRLGDLTQADGIQTVVFQATID